MTNEVRPNGGGFRVSPVDGFGRLINPVVVKAAEQIAWRAISYAEKLSIDPSVAANILEEAASAVSRTIGRRQMTEGSIRDMNSYLFRAFLRRLNRKHKRTLLVAVLFRTHAVVSQDSVDPRALLENKILIDEFLTHCDPVTRDILCHRIEGRSWKEIAEAFGISPRAAESRFNQRLQKVRKRLGLK